MTDAATWIGTIGGALGIIATGYTALRVKSIERFRAQLQAEEYEHQIRFAGLHERRMVVIADVYEKLTLPSAPAAATPPPSSRRSPGQRAGHRLVPDW
jgi:hypothetical protein